jgi:hypothetical protein
VLSEYVHLSLVDYLLFWACRADLNRSKGLEQSGCLPCKTGLLPGQEVYLASHRTISLFQKVSGRAWFSQSTASKLGSLSRYKLRGVRNIVFYGAPDHPQFFSELLSFPFLDTDTAGGVDASDVSCKVVWCRYDWMRLERILGTEGAKTLLGENSNVASV